MGIGGRFVGIGGLLGPLQQLLVFPELWSPELNTTVQVWPHLGRAEGQDHTPDLLATLSNTPVMPHPKGKKEPGITDMQEEFNIFFNDEDEGMEGTLSRCAGDTRLSVPLPLRDLDRLKWWHMGTS